MRRSIIALMALGAATAVAGAQSVLPGQPQDWQINLPDAMSPIEAQIQWFNNYVLAFIIPITVLVAALLAWVIWRYHERRNPTPSRTSHNTTIEVVWTLAPVIILLFIAIPSFQLLTAQYNPPSEPELTIKTTGYQWYWGYEYQPEQAEAAAGTAEAAEPVEPVSFESYPMLEEDRAAYGKEDTGLYPRLLAVDNELVVPVDTVIRLLATSADVIHAFALPAMGVKVDAVPGRINEYWFQAVQEGLYYGQCSELCGQAHYFMPIAVRVVSREQFQDWLATAATSIEDANAQLNASIESASAVAVAGR